MRAPGYRAVLGTLILICGLVVSPVPGQAAKDDVEAAGDAVRIALPALAASVALLKDDKDGLWQFTKSFVVSAGLTYGLKEAIDSRRPNGTGNDSFPSGHTANAFSAASYLDHRYGWKYGVPAYMAAGFVAYSRVEADEHHVRDVLAAALLSWGVSHLFVTPLPVTASGEVSPDGALLRISARW